MTLSRRDRLFICSVGFVVIVACALITLTRSADAQPTALASATSYSIVTAHGSKPVAHCPQGTRVVGGGGHQAYGYTFRAIDVESYPVGLSAWTFGIKSDTHRWIDTKAYAICAH
jgi:streptogramin lyase